MAQITETVAVGNEQVTVAIDVSLPAGGETIITGDFGGLVAAGTVARLRGVVNFTDNMHVRGTLLCDPTGVNVNGNGFDIHTHDGTLNLVGVEKTAWCYWGDIPVGWQVGDRVAIAPTGVGKFTPTEGLWTGDWDTLIRPVNSPDMTLVNLQIMRPEVTNLSQTVTLRNLKRIMIHEASAPNPQTLKWIRVLDSGETGVLGMYPVHFHMIGEHARGSLIEGVVVEGGKNHAFVTHGSHGITVKESAAYNTTNHAYWWDQPLDNNQPSENDSNDIVYDHCLALKVTGPNNPTSARLSGFMLGRGVGVKCVGSVAVGVMGGLESSGFHWPETGIGQWEFRDCVAHNNKTFGIFAWQNSTLPHVIEDFTAYRNGLAGIDHGAYLNFYTYRNITLTDHPNALIDHALSSTHVNFPNGRLVFEDILTNGPLHIAKHNVASSLPVFYRRCIFTAVTYNEVNVNQFSYIVHEDGGLTPADFTFTLIQPQSIVEIFEGGVLQHRWASGVWS